MKSGRHEKILDIISEYPIETQDELLKKLRESGYKATQATISRDIKELRLVKTLGSDGKYRYASVSSSSDMRSNFGSLFSGSAVSLDSAQNIVVIKTLSGMANAVCAALDSMDNTVVVGTIAGDDTIFIACRSSEAAQNLCDALRQYLSNR
ncbi:MAG TPA: arginine repressor [Ruminococcaceae bacterium]|nr:arginine repressor [Oscillospiraceae bacterium]